MMALPVMQPVDIEQAESAFECADLARARDLARALFDAADRDPDCRSAAGLLLLSSHHRLGEVDALRELLPRALAASLAAGDTTREFELLRVASLACAEARQFDEALRLSRELETRTAGLPDRQILVVVTYAFCLERMGDPWQARRLLEPLPAQAEAQGGGALLLRVLMTCAGTLLAIHHVLRDAGSTDEAVGVAKVAADIATRAHPLAQSIGDVWLLLILEGLRADAWLRCLRLDEAEQVLALAESGARDHGLDAILRRVRCLRAEWHLARGDAPAARAEVDAVLAEVDAAVASTVPLLRLHHVAYRAYVAQGEVASALAHLERYVALERQRTAEQLRAQSRELVSRIEVEHAVKQAERARGEAREYRRRADALADVAMKDALTGVLNRRGLDEQLAVMQRASAQVAVAMIDLDHFKRVNDTWGHAAGDQVLADLGQLFREHVRPRDVVARFGGEEFVLLLAGLSTEEAVDVCERLRQRVELLDWSAVAPGLHLTISIGLAVNALSDVEDASVGIKALLGPADAALYRAKAAGRNRVELAPLAALIR